MSQEPVSLGPRRAFRVRHEYVLLQANAPPLSVTQVSALFVLDGRGVAVTAAGRTELFRPIEDSILEMLSGLNVTVPRGAPGEPGVTPLPGVSTGSGFDFPPPVDLGRVGGKP